MASYYIQSSTWPAMKTFIPIVIENSFCLVGDGKSINAWLDNWLSKPLVQFMNIPISLHTSLKAPVSDLILDGKWSIPQFLSQKCPAAVYEIQQSTLSKNHETDMLVWKNSENGLLSFLEYLFLG